MNFSPRLLLPVCLAAFCRAQTPPSQATAHTHAPPPSSHGSVVVLDQFVTSAAPFARNQVDLAQSTTVLSGQSLMLKQRSTLGDTLSAETGIQATTFGPGASRPIIRGLGGDRIRLLENSMGTTDASVISPDHAVSLEPFLIDRIEVVRGPASLLYGSNAVGGVVNVITHRIETDLPAEPVRGAGEVRFGTAANERAGGGVLDASHRSGDRAVVFHVDVFRRETGNLRIPGFAESAAVRAEEIGHAEEHGEEFPVFAHARLPNSALNTRSGALGVSYVTSLFHFGVSHSGFESEYGVPGHIHEGAGPPGAGGVRIDLRQRRTDFQAEWHGEKGLLRGARLKFGRARYRHSEAEPDGTVGTIFSNRGYEGRLELLHGEAKPWIGAVGAQITRNDFGATGEEAFLPSSRTGTAAVFVFEEVTSGPIVWQFGGRYERTMIAPDDGPSRDEDEAAGSVGAVWSIDDTHVLAIALAHTGRAPNTQELHANGPHAGTNAFEIGDASLAPERSWGLEASLRRRSGLLTGGLTVFAHQFDNYIFEQPAGLVAVEDGEEWRLLAPDPDAAELADDGLPVYRYVQRAARFWGAEVETILHLHEGTRWNLDLRLAVDLTRAREGGRNLPRIPAARTTGGVAWSFGKWSAGAECQVVFRQSRIASFERPTDGYALVTAHISRTMEFEAGKCELFLRGANLLDEEARPHTSFVKELAPLAGRAVTAGIRLQF